jgi:phosphatidylethanolamine-binding protein (PEBP) family uncharacterized protein
MRLISPSFEPGGPIPARFTCEGEDISPEFDWIDAPRETKSFALIIHDPDAPIRNGFTHWCFITSLLMSTTLGLTSRTHRKSKV